MWLVATGLYGAGLVNTPIQLYIGIFLEVIEFQKSEDFLPLKAHLDTTGVNLN